MKERKKKSRILALLLAFVMVLSLMPMNVLADGEETDKNKVKVIVENTKYTADDAPWTGTLVDTWVEIDETSSIASCLIAVLDSVGAYQMGAETGYVSDINGLSAMMLGGMEGWMYMLNDWFTNEGMDQFTVASGKLAPNDEIRIVYSMDMGEDYGGTWANNDKTVKGLAFNKGTLSPAFDPAIKDYTLTLPAGTEGVMVTPTAANKNFQVRTYVDETEYKRTEIVPTAEGTVIKVKCGDPAWPSMNSGEWGNGAEDVPAEEYSITVAMEEPVEPEEVKAAINKVTNNGSFDYIEFSDIDGNPIEGLECSVEDTVINVILPKTYDISGKVNAIYHLTQNADGLPFITTKTAVAGTSSGKAVNNKFTEKTHTLSGGAATFTFYFYDAVPKVTKNEYVTYTLNLAVDNELPTLIEGQEKTVTAGMTAGDTYSLDVASLFTDADGDALTYSVTINGEEAVAADANYSYTTKIAGEYTFVFTASDGKGTSTDTYTVVLTVENSNIMETMTVVMPEGLSPVFYVTDGYKNGQDVLGTVLTAEETTEESMSSYLVSYPENAENISIRTEAWGGISVPTIRDTSASLNRVKFEAVDMLNNPLESSSTVKYGDYTATAGDEGYLLATGTEYSYTVTPKDTDYSNGTGIVVPETITEVQTITIPLTLKKPKTITVPTGAKAQLYAYNKYYDFSELTAKAVVNNEDGTTTYYYSTSNNQLTYRATMDGKVTEAGYWSKDVTVDFDNGANSSQNNASVSDNSVLVNVNGQNHLSMEIGETYKLKGYRIWEIIYNSTNNWIITPDFHFNILSGSDVISLEAVDSRSNGGSDEDSDWMNVTALKEGTAVIEVTYDAIDVAGGGWSGLYGASDSDRTALIIVTVGGADNSVKFGIDGYSSMGSLVYQEANKKDWDAEFDTLYFIGESGKLNFAPTASNEITEVAVSNNKGNDWTVLAAEEGSYTADITSGNNIIRVTTTVGTAYQIVRGAKVNVSVAEVDGAGNGNGLVDAGETVRVTFEGLYTPIPKMAGNYNPGYKANTQGDSSVHMVYTFNGESVNGAGAQYTFATEANYIDVTIPEDYTEKTIDLSEGYIAVGVIGLANFATGGDSHRNIPDGGCSTRGTETTFNTRSILPDITLTIGEETAPNNAPMVAPDAVTEGSIELGQNYALNPETLFTDKDGDILTYYVSVNGSEAEEVTAAYKFTPNEAGTYELVFTAKDKEAEASHTVILTVMPVEEPEPELDFNISEDEILGYTTISFEDYGVREEGATGLKYPEPLGMIIEATKVPYKADDTIADVTLRLLDALGIGYEYTGTTKSGFYLAAITDFVVDNTPYDYMGEFDAGSGSGWMITLNDVFINKGTSDFKAADGDVIRWQYTCQLGADIGDDYYQKAVKEVEGLIDAIGTVTLDSGEAISAARTAYDKLEDRQKEAVTNYNVLVAAEENFAHLKAEAEQEALDKAGAEAVIEKIEAIGEVSLESESAIEEAREAYEGLTDEQKALVTNLGVLEAAEARLEELKTEEPDEPGTEEPPVEPEEPEEEKSWWDKLMDKIFGNWWGDDDDSDEPTTEEPDEPSTEEPPVEPDVPEKPQEPDSGNWFGKIFNNIFGWIGSWWK